MSDWSLPDEAFTFLDVHTREQGLWDVTAVELGSGEGTARLVSGFGWRVHSVEHDEAWMGRVPGTNYIHAPIVDGWYDPAAIRAGLPENYHCLIIDGPPGAIGRIGMLRHLDLFKHVPVLLDDAHRPAEQRLLMGLVEAWGESSFSVHHLRGGRAFATFGWGDL